MSRQTAHSVNGAFIPESIRASALDRTIVAVEELSGLNMAARFSLSVKRKGGSSAEDTAALIN